MQLTRLHKIFRHTAPCAITFIVAAAVTASLSDRKPMAQRPKMALGHASYIYPDESLTDWKSYASQVAVIGVIEEVEVPFDPVADAAQDEGYVGRRINVEVERALWVAPEARAVEGALTLGATGWWLKDGQLLELLLQDAPRLRVGGRYVVPLVHDEATDSYGLLTGRSAAIAEGDAVAARDVSTTSASPIAIELSSMTSDEIQRSLDEAPIDPLVESFRSLPVRDRVEAVTNVRAPATM